MNPRHGFLLRCLSLADLYVTMAFHHQKQRFESARQNYVSRPESNTFYQNMLHEAQNARTLLAYKKIVETGLSDLQRYPSLLPALTPLYLLLQGMLPLAPEIM